MNKRDLTRLVEAIVEEEMTKTEQTKLGMSNNYLHKEAIMHMVQQALLSKAEVVQTQEEFSMAVDQTIEDIRADMDLTYDMVSRTLKAVPFSVFFQAVGSMHSNQK